MEKKGDAYLDFVILSFVIGGFFDLFFGLLYLKYAIWGLASVGMIVRLFGMNNLFELSKKLLSTYFVVVLFLIISFFYNGYEISFSLFYFSVLCVLLYFTESKLSFSSTAICLADRLFYWGYLFGIIYSMIGNHYFEEGTMVFEAIDEQNWTGVLVFIFFCYSWKLKRILGVFICLIYIILLSESRGLHIMTFVFLFSIVFRKPLLWLMNFIFFNKAWKLNFIIIITTIILSFYWILNVSVGELAGYREGFNDASNKMRFTANVFAISMIYDEPRLILAGYDNNLKKHLGISDDTADEVHTKENGVRLVQPHTAGVNLFVKLGVIPAIIALIMISSLIDKLKQKDNIEMILPYMFNSAFLTMYDIKWMLLWFFIIYMVNNSKNKTVSL